MATTKKTTKTDPRTSAGARLEREALRRYIRRQEALRRYIRRQMAATALGEQVDRVGAFDDVLRWVLERSRRYRPKPGGLVR